MTENKISLDEAEIALGELRYALLFHVPPNRRRARKAILRLSKAIYAIMKTLEAAP